MARPATGKVKKGGATDKGEAVLSCRRDGSPATVIVMRAWLAVAGVPPAAFSADQTKMRKNEQDGPRRSAQAPKRSAHGDGGVTCDIVVVVGFSSLVPFLK